MTTATGRNVQKGLNYQVTPENVETAVYAVSRNSKSRLGFNSMLYGSHFLNGALFHVFGNTLLDPVFSVHLPKNIYFS